MRLTLAGLGAGLVLLVMAENSAPISFRQMRDGDTIRVIYSSVGCFHFETREFEFHGGKDVTAKIIRIDRRWNEDAKQREEPVKTPLGTVRVSEAELAGLDRLLAYYRSHPLGGCTTVDEIEVTHLRGDRTIATESFTDATCGTYERKDLTLFWDLVSKLPAEPEGPGDTAEANSGEKGSGPFD